MTSEQFCYWLQGFTELGNAGPTPEQWKSIQAHLKTVFVKVTPDFKSPGYVRTLDLRPSDLHPYQSVNITC